jgi:hypothetical protein
MKAASASVSVGATPREAGLRPLGTVPMPRSMVRAVRMYQQGQCPQGLVTPRSMFRAEVGLNRERSEDAPLRARWRAENKASMALGR